MLLDKPPIFLQLSKYAERVCQYIGRTGRPLCRHVFRLGHRSPAADHAASAFCSSRGPCRRRNPARTRYPQLYPFPSPRQAPKRELLLPLENTGKAASDVLTVSLNARWQNEIIKPYIARFSGRYPFGREKTPPLPTSWISSGPPRELSGDSTIGSWPPLSSRPQRAGACAPWAACISTSIPSCKRRWCRVNVSALPLDSWSYCGLFYGEDPHPRPDRGQVLRTQPRQASS